MITIGAPATTIDTPLEHLSACHRRIEDQLATLGRAADHWDDSSSEALDTIRKSLKFLDTNGTLHTMDEEVSLFPRLRARLTAREAAHLDRLERQHHEIESVMAELKEVVAALAAAPLETARHEPRYCEFVTRLGELYRPHIQFEDEVLMRLAGRVLNDGDLQDISREMRARRTEVDEVARRVLHMFAEMACKSLDLHVLFEAGGNDPSSRNRVLDAVIRLVDSGHLEPLGSDFYSLTDKGSSAAALVKSAIGSS